MKLDIASPCRGICKIDEPSQLCIGCYRTIDEITLWRKLDDEQKMSVLTDCVQRQIRDQQIPSNAGSPDKSSSMAAGVPGSASEGWE